MPTTIYLSPNGHDLHEGTIQAPLATLGKALQLLRQYHDDGTLELPATIFLLPGVYHLKSPWDISTDFPLTITGDSQENTVVDGGLELTDWHPLTVNGIQAIQTDVPLPVHQLYFNEQPLARASFPRQDLYRIQDENNTNLPFTAGSHSLHAQPASFDPNWHNLPGIEVRLTHKWIEEYLPYKNYDAQTEVFTSTKKSTFKMTNLDAEYRIENVREALCQPGDFYYDSSDSTLTVIPPTGFDPAKDSLSIPLLGHLLLIHDARFLTLQNLRFRHAGAYRPALLPELDLPGVHIPNYPLKPQWQNSGCASAPQAAVQVPGCIIFHHAQDCDFHHCTVTASGWYGLQVSGGCSHITFRRNHLHHLGAGGIRISGAPFSGPVCDATSRISVTDNHLHDLGNIYLSACGILIAHSYGNLLEHNHIHDLYYSGISAGWVWGFGDSMARENRIGWNHIHDLGKKTLSDMGGIYLLGVQPGTRVYNNLIERVSSRYYGGWGIYTDEGSSHMVIENNVATDCSSEGFHQHFGRENVLRRNVFAFGGNACLAITRGNDAPPIYPGESFSTALASYDNVFVAENGSFFRAGTIGHFTKPTFQSENTIFVDCSQTQDLPIALEKDEQPVNLTEWQKRGFDRNAMTQNPGFKDLEKRDFTILSGSLLEQLQFPQLDRNQVGIRRE